MQITPKAQVQQLYSSYTVSSVDIVHFDNVIIFHAQLILHHLVFRDTHNIPLNI